MQCAVHSLHFNMQLKSPFASSERLRSLSDDEMQETVPYIPTTASINIRKPPPEGTAQKALSCIIPMADACCCPIGDQQMCNSADATMDTVYGQEYMVMEEGPEVVEESQGAVGDAYRFRYSRVSPEEGYSPIAGVSPFRRGGTANVPVQHVWVSHEDADGAICSKPIYGPLSIIVRAADGSDHTFQVRACMMRCGSLLQLHSSRRQSARLTSLLMAGEANVN
jgi:hypothetical protein